VRRPTEGVLPEDDVAVVGVVVCGNGLCEPLLEAVTGGFDCMVKLPIMRASASFT
jgi:hypothetical protein